MKKFTLLLAAALFCGSMSVFAQDDEDIVISAAQDDAGNPLFMFDEDKMYYVIELDDETKTAHLKDGQYVYIGPDEDAGRPLYVWQQSGNNTIVFRDTKGEKNSFGVPDAFKACTALSYGWTGMGYNVKKGSPIDLSGITDEFTFHFAVKSNKSQSVDFYLTDGTAFNGGKGHTAHLVLGSKKYGTDEPVGDFPRDDKWYNVDVPMTYLEDNFGLTFKNAKEYQDRNLLSVLIGTTLGNRLDYDAVFFYGPKGSTAGVKEIDAASGKAPVSVYTMDGKRVTEQYAVANKGVYIVKQGDKTKKVAF